MRDHKTLAIAFLLTLIFLIGYVVAFGAEAPEFPFKNLAQLEGMPGLKGEDQHSVFPCFGHEAARARFWDEAGVLVWQVFVQVGGSHFTGGYYGSERLPQFVYLGRFNPENGAMTITTVRPYNPREDFTPCDHWGTVA